MNFALLPWIILVVPLISAAAILLVLQRNQTLSAAVSVLACLTSLALSLVLFFSGGHEPVESMRIAWISVPGFTADFGIALNTLSKAMLLVVTGIGSLIHLYSLGYMAAEDGKSRYFAGLSLFMFSMLGIVLADNLVMMFLFWELVGVSSYILIGHWFDRPAAAEAAKKAFLVNRIGDFGFMIGILMLWLSVGSFSFAELEKSVGTLALHPCYLACATLLIFCGAVGKSAQVPLHVWLPDAMEGPTPVSALIHAATMVAAGVYMLARVSFLIAASPMAGSVIAWIGIITCVMAALMATQQDDIKRILAYSTLSQLGYMVMASGLAESGAAMFHLFTHAFFKALLFLGAGSVIVSMHHEQNIWKMGALQKKMPITFLTFLIGTLALVGCPGLSGFFSKDAILTVAFEHNKAIFALGLFAALLTAFYMTRLVIVAFLGAPRSEAAKHGHECPPIMTLPLVLLSIPAIFAGYGFVSHAVLHYEHPHPPMLVMATAIGAFVVGVLGAFALYRNTEKDPILIPLFRNRFYIDGLYAQLVRVVQDWTAAGLAWFDRWVLDLVIVRGLATLTWACGFGLRFLQIGNLQAYALLFGLGVAAFLYFTIFS